MQAGVYWIPAGRAISRNGRTPIVYKTEWAHVRQSENHIFAHTTSLSVRLMTHLRPATHSSGNNRMRWSGLSAKGAPPIGGSAAAQS
jgi:hypothetical protein